MFSQPLEGALQKQMLYKKLFFSVTILYLWSKNTSEGFIFIKVSSEQPATLWNS